ncbi:hypothetical protein BIW11_06000 [Tropilaelaps mercedesae]|uniref:Uncharacterized protein n=1 Tax=Tropilaelaps mercedesae TaxID=418985 RepID=A0A1V9Y003_9ACAR|nr:hypothetical protein BIW11_06000 [Tropilaelaps mercedesae]
MWRLVYLPIVGITLLSSLTLGLFKATMPEVELARGFRKKITPAILTRSTPCIHELRVAEYVREPPPRIFLENTSHLRPPFKKSRCKHSGQINRQKRDRTHTDNGMMCERRGLPPAYKRTSRSRARQYLTEGDAELPATSVA